MEPGIPERIRRSAAAPAPSWRTPWRLTLAALGVACVGLGVVGIFVPGLPTTVFLIAASYLFARSCPVLEERLLRAPLLRPYLEAVRGGAGMPRAARNRALILMWGGIAASLVVLVVRGAGRWLLAVLLLAAVAGTVAILRASRPRRPARSADPAP